MSEVSIIDNKTNEDFCFKYSESLDGCYIQKGVDEVEWNCNQFQIDFNKTPSFISLKKRANHLVWTIYKEIKVKYKTHTQTYVNAYQVLITPDVTNDVIESFWMVHKGGYYQIKKLMKEMWGRG